MFGERLSFNQKIVGTVYNFCWKNLSFLFVNIHFTVHYFTALCNSVNNHFTDLCLFFYFNYLNFLCVKLKSRMKTRFSHKLSATMIHYSHSAIRNIFTANHLTMITTETLARFMLEIWICFAHFITIATIKLFVILSLMIIFILELTRNILALATYIEKNFTIVWQTFVICLTIKNFWDRAGLRKFIFHLTKFKLLSNISFLVKRTINVVRWHYSKFFFRNEFILSFSKNCILWSCSYFTNSTKI